MHNLEDLSSGVYRRPGLTSLKLTTTLSSFPTEIFTLGDTLTQLDLSGTTLAALPDDFGPRLPKLKIAFFSDCRFRVFPRQLAQCPLLEMVAFRGNGMEEVPEDALPPRLRWLILTNNRIRALPRCIGGCSRLQKCMLAGNRLDSLPDEMAACAKLALLRLSSNRFERLPEWIFTLPELAFFSYSENPCAVDRPGSGKLPVVQFSEVETHRLLGEGASGIIHEATWPGGRDRVAVKMFRGQSTSDGTPAAEQAAWATVGPHPNLMRVLALVRDGEASAGGMVMRLVPPGYGILGLPPSLETCSRDCFDGSVALTAQSATSLLEGMASAAQQLHADGVCHGDLYAHNILVDAEGHAVLGDMGAATIYTDGLSPGPPMERLDVLGFAHLVEDVVGLVAEDEAKSGDIHWLWDMHRWCSSSCAADRPSFAAIVGAFRDRQQVEGPRLSL